MNKNFMITGLKSIGDNINSILLESENAKVNQKVLDIISDSDRKVNTRDIERLSREWDKKVPLDKLKALSSGYGDDINIEEDLLRDTIHVLGTGAHFAMIYGMYKLWEEDIKAQVSQFETSIKGKIFTIWLINFGALMVLNGVLLAESLINRNSPTMKLIEFHTKRFRIVIERIKAFDIPGVVRELFDWLIDSMREILIMRGRLYNENRLYAAIFDANRILTFAMLFTQIAY